MHRPGSKMCSLRGASDSGYRVSPAPRAVASRHANRLFPSHSFHQRRGATSAAWRGVARRAAVLSAQGIESCRAVPCRAESSREPASLVAASGLFIGFLSHYSTRRFLCRPPPAARRPPPANNDLLLFGFFFASGPSTTVNCELER